MKTSILFTFIFLIVSSFFYVGCSTSSVLTGSEAIIKVDTTKKDSSKITGKVIDKETKEPLVGANIALSSSSFKATVTNIDGMFEMMNIPEGSYAFSVSLIGYNKLVMPKLEVKAKTITNLDLRLEGSFINLDGPSIYELNDDYFFLQAGGSYNRLFLSDNTNSSSNKYTFQHAACISSIRAGIIRINQFYNDGFFVPFIEFNRTDGISSSPPSEISNRLQLDAFEIGMLVGHPLSFFDNPLKYVCVQAGIKCGGIINKPICVSGSAVFEFGGGLLLNRNPFFVSLESWFGLTNFTAKTQNYNYSLRENQFRFNIGYKFNLHHWAYM
jgi:hypothetical protein